MLPEAPADVVVVDDDPDLNEMIGSYVELAGYTYRSALDGKSAVLELRAQRPGLVLLDLMLPDIDGFEVCRLLQASESTRGVPVVFVSGVHEQDARQRARACGAREYVTKPFDPSELIEVIRRNMPVPPRGSS